MGHSVVWVIRLWLTLFMFRATREYDPFANSPGRSRMARASHEYPYSRLARAIRDWPGLGHWRIVK